MTISHNSRPTTIKPTNNYCPTMTAELNSDKPISRKKDDLLNRHPLAYRIADLINKLNNEYKDSIVIGIEGEWGSGKSSFINLILNLVDPERLEDEEPTDPSVGNKNVEANERNIVIEFNPWNFSDQGELVKDFFGSIAEKFPDGKDDSDGKDSIRSKFRKLVSKLKPREITLKPSVSVSGVEGSVGEVKWEFNKGEDLDEPLQKQKDDIDEDIEKLGKRIIIIIDDIDRLDSDETKLIFKLVKLTANFANTVFMLAYDRNRVGERLTENNINGEEYLKKIVQVSFLIPKPDPGDIHRILKKAILEALKLGEDDKESWDKNRFYELVDSTEFKKLFSTIRDIRRYTNSLHLDLEIIDKEEVNRVDFIGIEAIRVFAPEVYLAMTDENEFFTSVGIPEEEEDKAKWVENREKRIKEVIGVIDETSGELSSSIVGIIYLLFPTIRETIRKLKSKEEVEWVGQEAEESSNWKGTLRICSPDIFDKYFRLSVPKKLLSEIELKKFVNVAHNSAERFKMLKDFEEKGKLLIVLERLPYYLDNLEDQQQRENVLVGIFDFVKKDAIDVKSQVLQMGYENLKGVEKGGRTDFLKKIINTTKGFLIVREFLSHLNEKAEKQENKGPLLVKEEIAEVGSEYIKKIPPIIQDSLLQNGDKLKKELSAWIDWGLEKEVKNYTTRLIGEKKVLLNLLRIFRLSAPSPTANGEKTGIKLDEEALETFFDTDNLLEKVNAIDTSKLSKEDNALVESYKKLLDPEPPKKGFWRRLIDFVFGRKG